MRLLVFVAALAFGLAAVSYPNHGVAAEQAPIDRLQPPHAPVFYIWMDGEIFRNLKAYPGTAANIFVDSRTAPIFAWHTPLGALAENLGHRTNLEYGTVLVKVVLDKPERIRSVDSQPDEVLKGELIYHAYAMPRIMQFHEWIFSSENVKEWSAFTDEIEQDLIADLERYRSSRLSRNDTHFYGERFDRMGTIRAAEKILSRFKKYEPIRRVRPSSVDPICELMFTSQL